MSDDRPSNRLLDAWAELSARSRPRPLGSPKRVGSSVAVTFGGAAAAAAVLAVVLIGVFASAPSPLATASPSPHAPSDSGTAQSLPPTPTGSPAAASAHPSPTISAPAVFRDVPDGGLVTPDDGWALTSRGLLVTHDGGRSWTVTTNLAPGDRIVGAAFADAAHGWLVSDQVPGGGPSGVLGVDVHRTDDGGVTWETVRLASIPSDGPAPLVGFPTFSVVSPDIGFLILNVAGIENDDLRLFATLDGGRNWELRSTFASGLRSVTFVDAMTGWIVRDRDNALIGTVDGGRSWAREGLPAVPGIRARDLYPFGGPARLDDGGLILYVPAARDGDPGAFFTRPEGGSSWEFEGRGPSGGGAIAAYVGGRRLIAGLRPLLYSDDDGVTWQPVETTLPGPAAQITVVDVTHLSALIAIYACGPMADCYIPQELWLSDDAGLTWRNATP